MLNIIFICIFVLVAQSSVVPSIVLKGGIGIRAFAKPSPQQLLNQADSLSSEWSRYLFLRQFLDCVPESPLNLKFVGDEVGWNEVNAVLALALGFRVVDELSVCQLQELAPLGWGNLECSPDFSDLLDQKLEYLLCKDLPSDDGATDMFLEAIVGLHMYEQMKKAKEKDLEVRRRVLIARWLYVQGFLTTSFPQQERFVPHHIRNSIENEEDDSDTLD